MLRSCMQKISPITKINRKLTHQFQQARKTHVVKRRYEPFLSKEEGMKRKFLKRNNTYDWLHNTDFLKYPPVQLILKVDVEGIGSAGEVVPVKPSFARNYLLPTGKAIHASPDNLRKLEEDKALGIIPEKTNSSLWAPITAKHLSTYILPVFMHLENPWTLEPWHIRVAFRMAGYHVPDDAITLPRKEIAGPNVDYEGREFAIKVTINNQEWAYVRCRIHHWTAIENKQLPPILDYWFFPAEPIFPEDAEFLNKLPKPCKRVNELKLRK